MPNDVHQFHRTQSGRVTMAGLSAEAAGRIDQTERAVQDQAVAIEGLTDLRRLHHGIGGDESCRARIEQPGLHVDESRPIQVPMTAKPQ